MSSMRSSARRPSMRSFQTLSRAQKSAWNLADEDGNIDIDKATKFVKQKHKTRNHVIALTLAVSASLIGIGVMASMLTNKISRGNVEVQNSIEKASTTNVALDQLGLAHLTDKSTGEDIVSVLGIIICAIV